MWTFYRFSASLVHNVLAVVLIITIISIFSVYSVFVSGIQTLCNLCMFSLCVRFARACVCLFACVDALCVLCTVCVRVGHEGASCRRPAARGRAEADWGLYTGKPPSKIENMQQKAHCMWCRSVYDDYECFIQWWENPKTPLFHFFFFLPHFLFLYSQHCPLFSSHPPLL